MSHIFISYSRKDLDFAGKIVQALAENALDTWIDWKSIPKGEDWEQEIYRGIEEADAFLFLISPDSVTSKMCNKEIAYAVENNKRILPIVIRDTNVDEFLHETAKKEISKRNWIFSIDGKHDFRKAIEETRKTIHTDFDWVRFHTDLLIKAKRWEQRKDNSRLLRGKELREAEEQLASAGSLKEPQPTELHRQYVLASQRNEVRQRRQITISLGFGLIVVAMLAVFAWYQKNSALASEATTIAEKNAKATALINEENANATAQAEKVRAEAQAKIARAGELAAQSVALYNPSEFDLSLLFSVEAFHTIDSSRTRGILLDKTQANPQLLQYLDTNTDLINSIAYSPDGKTLASGNMDGTITLWDVNKLQPIGQPLKGHTKLVSSVTFSPDGKTLASCSWDNTIVLWDVVSRQPIGQPLTGNFGAPFSIAFSSDGKILASGDGNHNVLLWDINKHQPIGHSLTGHTDWVFSVAFSPDGKMLATGSQDRTIILWDVASQQPLSQLPAGGNVRSVAFSLDGRMLAAGSDSDITFWDTKTYQRIGQPLKGHTNTVTSIVFSPNGKTLASGSWDKSIILWDAKTFQRIGQPLTGHTGEISSLAFSPDGKTLASGSCGKIDNLAFGATVTRCTKGEIILWGTEIHQQISQLLRQPTFDSVNRVAFHPDGNILAASDSKESILLWDMKTHKAIDSATNKYFGSNVVFSPDKKTFASSNCGKIIPFDCTQGGEIILWDLETQQPSGKPLKGHKNWIYSMAFSPDGKILASGSCGKVDELNLCTQGEIILWDVETHEPIGQPLIQHTAEVWSVAFSPDGKILASGSRDKTVRLWDVATHEPIGLPLADHTGEIFSIAFNLDGNILASGSNDRSIILWNVVSGKPIGLPLKGHTHYVESVVFSPDGKTLASGGADGTIILWDLENHQPIGVLLTGHNNWIKSMAYNPDGKILVSSNDIGAITLWDTDPEAWVVITCQRVGRNFTQSEWLQYFPNEPYRSTCPQWPAGQ